VSLRTTGNISSNTGKATNQESNQEPNQRSGMPASHPTLLKVLIKLTIQVIKQDKIKGITTKAYLAGNFWMVKKDFGSGCFTSNSL